MAHPKVPLKVLIVEDSEDDLILLLKALEKGKFDVTYKLVQTEVDLRAALSTESWQVAISDNSLPGFDAYRALDIVKFTTNAVV
ncbi:MAG: hypothetical protein AB7N80_14880 [Bdellovibrionales bacterium]